MAKILRLEPIAEEMAVQTNSNLLSALMTKELHVLKECGGGECVPPVMFLLRMAWMVYLKSAVNKEP